MRDEDVIIDQTGHGQPTVDILEDAENAGCVGLVLEENLLHEAIP